MRKILMIVALFATVHICAALRTPSDALRIADEFVESSKVLKQRSAQTAQRSNSVSGLTIADSSAVYFAVNTANSFVLVGADDRLPEVLGYSDSGTFDPDNISPQMRYWLNSYEEELSNLKQRSAQTAQRSNSANGLSAVSPLMTSKWNQSSPYNNYAPAYNDEGSKCVTGCVATAMAQVMYYHKHPAKGTGSHSYLWVCVDPIGKSGTLSANFGSTTYKWSNMIDNYRTGYTTEQADAVATLMYHCGVSINMSYGQSSGAYTDKVPVALKEYFNYDGNYQRIQKVMYPADSLNAIIAAELKASRPVIVSGHNDEGGHAFVCDGCDNKGYFHINWGWGGSNDGYFLLTALNPHGTQGIGGTTQGYNKGTSFFIGLQPAKSGTPKAIPQIATSNISVSTSSVNRGSSFTVKILQMQNYGLTDFSGSYGVALYDEDETKLVKVLKQVDNYSLSAGKFRTTSADLSVSIPTSTTTVPNGTYHLCAVYKDANYGWMKMLCTEDDYYRTLDITSTKATFYANDAEPVLTLTKKIAFPSEQNTEAIPFTGAPLSFSVKNTGGTFRGDISARIYKSGFSKGQYEIVDSVVIRRNKSLSSALQQEFEGTLQINTKYTMKLCWRIDESDGWHTFEPAEYAELDFQLTKCTELEEYQDVICADQTTYSGYGFTISEDKMPAAGESREYTRTGKNNNIDECDTLINFMLTVKAFDTTDIPVTIPFTELPYTVDADYTVPAEASIGSYEHVIKIGDTGCSYKRYLVTVTDCEDPFTFEDNICSVIHHYEGHGFTISEQEMPEPGSSKQYTRRGIKEEGCDSLITLTLRVQNAVITSVGTWSLLNTDLPYEVDDYYTIPAEQPIGTNDTIIQVGDCSFRSYTVTISACTKKYRPQAQICQGEEEYRGNGFTIPSGDWQLPLPGNSRQYTRHALNEQGCDSTIILTLTVFASDTVDQEALTVSNKALPYYVDEFYTVPEDAQGEFEAVVPGDGQCVFYRYFITVRNKGGTAIDGVNHTSQITNHKYIQNGVLYIEYSGHIYNAQGVLIQ